MQSSVTSGGQKEDSVMVLKLEAGVAAVRCLDGERQAHRFNTAVKSLGCL